MFSRTIKVLHHSNPILIQKQLLGIRRYYSIKKYPLSHPQLDIWYDWLKSRNKSPYYISLGYEIRGPLNIPKLQNSFSLLLNKYSPLRLRIGEFNGVPYFYENPISISSHSPLKVVDISKSDNLSNTFDFNKKSKRSFHLIDDPMYRFILFSKSSDLNYLLINTNHIVCDGFTTIKVLQDLQKSYKNNDQNLELYKPVQLGLDEWNNQYTNLTKESEIVESTEYWKQYLNTNSSVEPSLSDKSVDTISQKILNMNIPGNIAGEILNFAAKNSISPFRIMLAGFQALLCRYNFNLDDQKYDMTMSYTDDLRLQNNKSGIGHWVSSTPIRTIFHPEMNFENLVQNVSSSVRNARKHIPFSLLKYLSPEECVNFKGFPKVNFAQTPYITAANFQLDSSLEVKFVTEINGQLNGDLFLMFGYGQDSPDSEIRLDLCYNGNKFEKYFIQNMMKSYTNLLEKLISNPKQRITEHVFLSDEVIDYLTNQINRIAHIFPTHETIHGLFETQVEMNSESNALRFNGQTMSYNELNKVSNQLANHLIEIGVGPEILVGVSLEQSFELIVSLLAVLKSGGAFVPIDPNSQSELRKDAIMKDTKLNTLITTSALASSYFKSYTGNTVLIDNKSLLNGKSRSNPEKKVTPKNLAYVLYTSGSTGTPKGVCIEHRSIVNSLCSHSHFHNFSSKDRVIQKTPFTFDVAVWEIFGPLISGAELIITPPGLNVDPIGLQNLVKQASATVIHFVPSLLTSFLSLNWNLNKHLRLFVTSGEACTPDLRKKTLEIFPHAQHIDMYGPTEAAVNVSYSITNSDTVTDNSVVNIGQPIWNTEFYILDKNLHLVPPGAQGELYIGGENVARGYLNRPELNQKYFINNPFKPSQTLYKTGDLVKYLANGDLQYLGRIDSQIKVRGIRIEPGEIESILRGNEFVDDAGVIAKSTTDTASDKRIIAFIAFKEPGKNDFHKISELRKYLQGKLPNTLLPEYFVPIEKLPLTSSGKLDRKLMEKMEFSTEDRAESNLNRNLENEKFTEIETILFDTCASVLGHENFNLNDNFFEVGGNSILATQLFIKLHQMALLQNLLISIRDFFMSPVISSILKSTNDEEPKDKNSNWSQCKSDPIFKNALFNLHTFHGPRQEKKSVLLTGATGFLGTYLLDKLRQSDEFDKIYCLNRANKNSEFFKHFNNFTGSKVIPIFGNLEGPKLNIESRVYSKLLEEVSIVCHNGANVNHVQNYDSLKPANVLSTLELLKFCSVGRLKDFHYISTLGSAIDKKNNIISEDFPSLEHEFSPILKDNGYICTKFASEVLVSNAKNSGVPVNIYRPPWIGGASTTGHMNPWKDQFCCLVKSCIHLSVAPDVNYQLNFQPVDLVAETIVNSIEYSARSDQASKVYNISNPNPLKWKTLIQLINESGFNVSLINPEDWKLLWKKNLRESDPLYPFASLYINEGEYGLLSIPNVNIEYNNFNELMENCNLSYLSNSSNDNLFSMYLKYFQEIGFLDKDK